MVFNRLTALSLHERYAHKPPKWRFLCSCGKEHIACVKLVVSGHTSSCGCLAREVLTARNTGHGLSKASPKTYRTWKDMRSRCNTASNADYANYGGRGIKVCQRWNDFALFLEDMGPRPEGMTIERIDVDKGYEPSNCKWATIDEQANNKRQTVRITHNGQTKSMTQWAKLLGKSHGTLSYRLKNGLEPITEKDYRIDHAKA